MDRWYYVTSEDKIEEVTLPTPSKSTTGNRKPTTTSGAKSTSNALPRRNSLLKLVQKWLKIKNIFKKNKKEDDKANMKPNTKTVSKKDKKEGETPEIKPNTKIVSKKDKKEDDKLNMKPNTITASKKNTKEDDKLKIKSNTKTVSKKVKKENDTVKSNPKKISKKDAKKANKEKIKYVPKKFTKKRYGRSLKVEAVQEVCRNKTYYHFSSPAPPSHHLVKKKVAVDDSKSHSSETKTKDAEVHKTCKAELHEPTPPSKQAPLHESMSPPSAQCEYKLLSDQQHSDESIVLECVFFLLVVMVYLVG